MKIEKILLLTLSCLLICSVTQAQQAFGGKPKSFTHRSLDRNRLRSLSPEVGQEAVRLEVERRISPSALRTEAMGQVNAPMTAGEVIPVSYDLVRQGERELLSDGSSVYRLRVRGARAKSIYLFFSRLEIPRGGRLFVYTPDKSIVLGAYTEATNPTGGAFAIEPVPGDELVLEYEATAGSPLPRITIDGVGYLYYTYQAHAIYQKAGEDEERTGCQEDANCQHGEGWDDQKNSIVQILLKKGGRIELCSGTLLNNTNQDFKPYIITAGHCAAHKEGQYDFPKEDLDRWVFSFHYIKPSCSRGTVGSIEGKSLIGCRKLTYLPMDKYSDGMLLELNQDIPLSYRVYYSGWDRRQVVPSNGVSLHHPLGDAMKISVFDQQPEVGKWDGYNKSAEGAHLIMSFTHGETEGGSSGGGLFDGTSKKLIGTLTGGQDIYKCLPSSQSWYGRLAYHWDRFKDKGSDKRMDIYLDPKTGGTAESLGGVYREDKRYFYPVTNTLAMRSRSQKNLVLVTWESPKEIDHIGGGALYYDVRRGEVILQRIPHIAGQSIYTYTDNVDEVLGLSHDLSYSVRAVLLPERGNPEWTSWSEPVGVYMGDLPEEIHPSVEGRKLSWVEPILVQEWTRVVRDGKDKRFTPIPMAQIQKHPTVQIARQQTIKYAEKWPTGALYPLRTDARIAPSYINQISIMPHKAGERFTLILDYGKGPVFRRKSFSDSMEGEENYKRRIPVTVPASWRPGEWLPIVLERPMRIYPEYMLRVSFEAINTTSPSSMCYMKLDETSLRYRFLGPLVMIVVNSKEEWYPIYFMSTVHKMIPEYWQGNMAFRLMVTNSQEPLSAPIADERIVSYSSALPALPRPTGYSIQHLGNQESVIPATTDASYSYTAQTAGDYIVRPVYESVPERLGVPEVRPHVPIKLVTEGKGSLKLYGYAEGTEGVRSGSVVWTDAYPEEGYTLKSLTANGKDIYYSGEIWVGNEPITVVAKFEKAKPAAVEAITAKSELTAYPSPMRTEGVIAGLTAGARVHIYTAEGQLVYRAVAADGTLKLNATSFAPGVYLARTEDGRTVRFIIGR